MLERQLQDVLEVYEIQEDELDQPYLNRWAAVLGVADLLDKIRAQAAHRAGLRLIVKVKPTVQ